MPTAPTRSGSRFEFTCRTWSTWSAVISLTSRAGELRSHTLGLIDPSLAESCRDTGKIINAW